MSKKTYYLLSGEGLFGAWSGPFTTTEHGIKWRAGHERSHGDRWCSVWELVPETTLYVEHLAGLDKHTLEYNGQMRDVPNEAASH